MREIKKLRKTYLDIMQEVPKYEMSIVWRVTVIRAIESWLHKLDDDTLDSIMSVIEDGEIN